MSQLKNKKSGKHYEILLGFQLIISIVFILFVKLVNILPDLYFFGLIGLVLLAFIIAYLAQTKKHRKTTAGKISRIISIVLCVCMAAGSIFLYQGYDALAHMTASDGMKIENISVIVLSNDKADKISDVKDKIFAIRDVIDLENTNFAVEKINERLHKDIATKKYVDFDSQINDLYRGSAQVMLLNETYRSLILDKFPDFESKTKVIYTVRRETAASSGTQKPLKTDETFNVLLTGIDAYGPLDEPGRSDVNIVATIDPKGKKILLTSVPRDYYVELNGEEGNYDKLTHAGFYGVDCSMSTLEALLDTKIPYYIKVNFSSFANLIDALDGINVYSEYAFTEGEYEYIVGWQEMRGLKALTFARDRTHMPFGDRDRGKNQEAVISAMVDKMTSPSIIVNYNAVLKALSGSFETNMTSAEITSLIQMQLVDMADWTITSITLNGGDAYRPTYTMGSEKLYVMVPYEDSVNEAIETIYRMFNPNAPINEEKPEDE